MLGGTIKLNPLGVVFMCGSIALVLLFYLRSSGQPTTINLKTLLIESIIAAEKGGVQVKTVHDLSELNIKSKGKTKEGANNPVTDADLNSHYAIINSLNDAIGKDVLKIVSEEHSNIDVEVKNIDHAIELHEINKLSDSEVVDLSDVVVWIDPLDATQEFTEDLLEYVTVMVCIAVKGKPVIGVIHKPFKQETAWAWVGQGTSSNLNINTEAGKVNSLKKIIVSRSHSGTIKEVAKEAFGTDTEIIPAGGAGYKVLKVISGDADAYVHATLIKKWDICAGNALLNAMGGQMTTLKGDSIKYDELSGEKNEAGLLATLHDHNKYLKSLNKVENKI